jgi:hypothetical protein
MWKSFNYVICSLQELNMGGNINILLSAWGIFHMMFNIYTFKDKKPKDHYTKNYDSKNEVLHFQNVEKS